MNVTTLVSFGRVSKGLVVVASVANESLTWCREHPPMGDDLVAASISSGRKLKNIGHYLAEVLAIREAMVLFAASSWAKIGGIIVECNSMNAVTWLTKPPNAPWRIRQLIFQIGALRDKVLNWQIRYIPGSRNEVADNLAKTGIERPNDLIRILL
ncbi:Uncharacterized protein TCM_019370 [Theobroma cacao]|uniref:RNase H type-1 domain-containing protein n=1 Tax=Theobroma cacao TaxID=3641 RepID=A0A061EP51_THECC|nr:Uncharacterized protein TCM_019370 [Theobroma cacao]